MDTAVLKLPKAPLPSQYITDYHLIDVLRDENQAPTDNYKGYCRSNVFVRYGANLPVTFKCVAVEDIVRAPGAPKVYGETAIDQGVYPLELTGIGESKFSPWFWTKDDVNLITRKEYTALPLWQKKEYHAHKVIWIRNVPFFELIRAHWGNGPDDTDGCLVVGTTKGKVGAQPGVLASQVMYVKFYAAVAGPIAAAIKAGKRETIRYVDQFSPSKYYGKPVA